MVDLIFYYIFLGLSFIGLISSIILYFIRNITLPIKTLVIILTDINIIVDLIFIKDLRTIILVSILVVLINILLFFCMFKFNKSYSKPTIVMDKDGNPKSISDPDNVKGRDWNKPIHSFSKIINNMRNSSINIKDGKIIGKIVPIHEDEIKYNGLYVTQKNIYANGGTLITGATGSGKTETWLSFLKQDLLNGKSVQCFDYKGDPNTVKKLQDFCEKHHIKFVNVINYNETGIKTQELRYDPLENLNQSSKVEALLNMRKWSSNGNDAHYRTSTQALLQSSIAKFEQENPDLSEDNINQDTGTPKNYTIRYAQFLINYKEKYEEKDAKSTIVKMLQIILTHKGLSSIFFRSVNDPTDTQIFTMKDMNKEQICMVWSFNSAMKELAESMSSMIFRDLLFQGTITPYAKNGVALYVDEFGSLQNSTVIKDILEKGRSAKISSVVAMQDINQLIDSGSEAYANSILGTVNTFIVHNGVTENTAKIMSLGLVDSKDLLKSRKPLFKKDGTVIPPTAYYITRYPEISKKNYDNFMITPYIFNEKDYDEKTKSHGESKLVKFIDKTEENKTNQQGTNTPSTEKSIADIAKEIESEE